MENFSLSDIKSVLGDGDGFDKDGPAPSEKLAEYYHEVVNRAQKVS